MSFEKCQVRPCYYENVVEITSYALDLYIIHFGIYWIDITVLAIGGG